MANWVMTYEKQDGLCAQKETRKDIEKFIWIKQNLKKKSTKK